MASLTTKQKIFICQKLAEYNTFENVRKAFYSTFGHTVFNSRIAYYRNQSKKWMEFILELRKAWAAELGEEKMSVKRIRLRMLQEVYDKTIDTDTYAPGAAVNAVKQAQEEMEGRKVRLAGHDGKELKTAWTDRLAQLEEAGEFEQDESDPSE